MSVPVVVCDDSSFARKQIARALPTGWDVDVTFAANGREAIAAIRAGRGDILFLDLTMPEMDGFDVLEVIRREDLPTMTIVVSGDIQPESRRRVMELGAVAFVKKPVDGEALAAVLADYGVLGVLTEQPAAVEVEVDFRDWCQEIANVAMGRAADLLAKLMGEGVELSVPRVNLLERAELDMTLAAATGNGFAAVSQGFIGGGIAGETLLLFGDSDVSGLGRAVHTSAATGAPGETELLLDVAGLLVGAFLKGVADQLDLNFSQGHPRLFRNHDFGRSLTPGTKSESQRTLTIELSYSLGRERVSCDQLILFPEHSLAPLQQRAQYAFN